MKTLELCLEWFLVSHDVSFSFKVAHTKSYIYVGIIFKGMSESALQMLNDREFDLTTFKLLDTRIAASDGSWDRIKNRFTEKKDDILSTLTNITNEMLKNRTNSPCICIADYIMNPVKRLCRYVFIVIHELVIIQLQLKNSGELVESDDPQTLLRVTKGKCEVAMEVECKDIYITNIGIFMRVILPDCNGQAKMWL